MLHEWTRETMVWLKVTGRLLMAGLETVVLGLTCLYYLADEGLYQIRLRLPVWKEYLRQWGAALDSAAFHLSLKAIHLAYWTWTTAEIGFIRAGQGARKVQGWWTASWQFRREILMEG